MAPKRGVDVAPARDVELLRLSEVAERLKMHVVTVRSLITRGELRAVRLSGRTLFVESSELAAFVERRRLPKAAS
jgi:excisionase family DNA binding protein